jgi:hypothetical protein
MKKLKSVLCVLVLALSPAAIPAVALAGEIPIGGFCDSAECVQQSQPVDGGTWVQIGENMWVVGGIY